MLSWSHVRQTVEWPQTRTWLLALLLSGSAFWATRQLAVHSHISPIAAYLVAFSCVVACVLLVAICAPSSVRLCLAGAVVAILLIAGAQQPRAAASSAALATLLGLLALGSALGTLIGRRVRQPGHLLFVAIVSGLADTWSVTQPGGISHVIANEPAALGVLALPWPLLGTPDIAPLLGVGDVVFVALYFGATRALGLPVRRTLLAMISGFLLTTLCVVALEQPIPVLPWLGSCFVVAQPAARVVPADDMRRGAWVLTALAVAFAAWVLRRSL